jgi:signal transduction histidine kinase
MSIQTKVISRKLISIIVAAMFFMAAAIAIVIGISGYANLESITRANNERAANVISKQIEADVRRSAEVLTSMELSVELNNLMVLLSTLGPYYFEEGMEGSEIEAADQIYSLQSQLELASLLKPIILSHNLDSITLYHIDAFAAKKKNEPSFAMRLNHDGLDMAQYQKKDHKSAVASSIVGEDFARFLGLFDVSSIYELSLDDFLTNISANKSFATPESPASQASKAVSRLIFIDGLPVIQTALQMKLPMSNPVTWGGEIVNAFVVVIEQTINQQRLEQLKGLVNVDILMRSDGEVMVSTLANLKRFNQLFDNKVTANSVEYFSAQNKIVFTAGRDDLRELEILAISPVSEVVELNFQLFIQIFLVIIICTVMVCVLYYFLIARIINAPLSALMKGVEHLAQGELQHLIEVNTDDEMGHLAKAFNDMSADVHKKNNLLKDSHEELKQILEQQAQELESTQMQLIEAEKMSSLGELVAGVSHEVSTPIGICITAESFFRDEARLIQQKFNDGSMARQDFTDFLKIALDNGQILSANLSRTAELIRNFKQVAVDQCIEDLRPFAVYNYIVDLLSTLKPRIKYLKHVIEVTGDEKLVVTTLPGALAQIVTNLIMNSIIHGFEGVEKGHISIEIIAQSGGVMLVYKDDGIGMTEEALSKVFDPFFTTRKEKGGTGLGMNIVYKLITDTLHGHIKCMSQIGQGVKFEIFIADQEV